MNVRTPKQSIKIATIIGARPQFIKAAPICRTVEKHNMRYACGSKIQELLVHTGQHYDYLMSKIFFDELGIPEPAYNLGVGSGNHGQQTGLMLQKIEEVLMKERPDYVLVYGDTNSTLAGALAGSKLHIPVIHVEAGLRSYNRRMPEEINRVVTDHISTILFCPTEIAVRNLIKEGLNDAIDNIPLVINVGDVMYDSLIYNIKIAEQRSKVLELNGLSPKRYYLSTIHRAENTDNRGNLCEILMALNNLPLPVVMPIHPRTKLSIKKNNIPDIDTSNIKIIDPLSYFDMITLEKNAHAILTDSGGIQKEAYLLKVPCITLREETEWIETVEAGWNVLVGAKREKILEACNNLFKDKQLANDIKLYGDGHSGERIVDEVVNYAKIF